MVIEFQIICIHSMHTMHLFVNNIPVLVFLEKVKILVTNSQIITLGKCHTTKGEKI